MSQQLKVCIAFAEDLSLVSNPALGSLQLPRTLVSGNLTASPGLCGHLCSDACVHNTHIQTLKEN